jgi:hypothetical protein
MEASSLVTESLKHLNPLPPTSPNIKEYRSDICQYQSAKSNPEYIPLLLLQNR